MQERKQVQTTFSSIVSTTVREQRDSLTRLLRHSCHSPQHQHSKLPGAKDEVGFPGNSEVKGISSTKSMKVMQLRENTSSHTSSPRPVGTSFAKAGGAAVTHLQHEDPTGRCSSRPAQPAVHTPDSAA